MTIQDKFQESINNLGGILMKKLPNKPSALIRVAIADMKAASKSRKYTINMDHWHLPSDRGTKETKTCYVCLAGSVMAFSLDACRKEVVSTVHYDDYTEDRLIALDEFRNEVEEPVLLITIGKISEARRDALSALDMKHCGRMAGNSKAQNKPKFYRDMLWLADRLEELKF